MEVNDQNVERIKTGLGLTKLITNTLINNDAMKTVLNLTIRGSETSMDLTYGLLILSSLNEMDFIDMVASQRYKTEAKEYFNSILDEKLNLITYYKNIGYDIPRIVSGNITGPMSALILNSFAMTDKIITIFAAFENIKEVKIYDGLWTYFDDRRGNNSHETAWDDTKEMIGFGIRSSLFSRKIDEDKELRLELQFAALWDKWGQYTTSQGLKEEAKQQIKNDLSDTFVAAVKTYQSEPKTNNISLGDKLKSSLINLWDQTKDFTQNIDNLIEPTARAIADKLKPLISKLQLLSPAAIVQAPQSQQNEIPPEIPQKEKDIENKTQTTQTPKVNHGQNEKKGGQKPQDIQESIDDISENIDIIQQEINQLSDDENPTKTNNKSIGINKQGEKPKDNATATQQKTSMSISTSTSTSTKDKQLVNQKNNEDGGVAISESSKPDGQSESKQEIISCEKNGNPLQNKVIFNEIAWMGSINSASKEWIELKNISGNAINLSGWQIINQEKQIKINFEQKTLPTNEFFLLERTNDESVPSFTADLIYTGALKDQKETLYLFDNNCQLMDEVSANPDWPAGDKVNRRTMERNYDLTWHTYSGSGQNEIFGTPRQSNSQVIYYTGGGNLPTPPTPAPIIPPPLSQKILITEVQIETASSADYDFIELYNPATSSMDISGFQLKKKTSTGNEYSIRLLPENSVIQAQSYYLWINSDYASNSKIAFDTASNQTIAKDNSIALLDKDKNIVDALAWGTSVDPFVENQPFLQNPTQEKSLARKWSTTTQNYIDTDNNQADFEIQNATPKTQNQSSTVEPQSQSKNETSSTTISETPSLTVVINEIAWMGTNSDNSGDEWIEFYNNTTSTISLTNWRLASADGGPDIIFGTSTIPANGFYLIERTDDNTVSNITADWSGSFGNGLNNTGEKLEIRNANNNLIDLVDCSSGWFAGTTSPAYISMERINSKASGTSTDNWANNNLISRNGLSANGKKINGTPKAENSVSKSSTQILALPFDEFNEITLTDDGNPYIIQNTLNVPQNKKLTIEPDVTLKFFVPDVYGPGDGASLQIGGTLKALGQLGKEIIFTSTGALWPGITFDANAPESNISSWLEYVKIEKARSWESSVHSAIKVNQKAVSIKNSTIENKSNYRGLYLINSSSTIDNVVFDGFTGSVYETTGEYPSALYIKNGAPIIKNSNFSNDYYGITAETDETCLNNPDFKISGNSFDQNSIPIYLTSMGFPCFSQNQITNSKKDNLNNVFDGILFKGINLSQNTVWQSDSPLIIEKGFSINNATLTVPATTTVKFKYSNDAQSRSYLKVESDANLIVQGEPDKWVYFTSAKEVPAAGNWMAIWIEGGSADLNYAKIRYGGFGTGQFRNECLIINSPNVVLNNIEKEVCTPY